MDWYQGGYANRLRGGGPSERILLEVGEGNRKGVASVFAGYHPLFCVILRRGDGGQ